MPAGGIVIASLADERHVAQPAGFVDSHFDSQGRRIRGRSGNAHLRIELIDHAEHQCPADGWRQVVDDQSPPRKERDEAHGQAITGQRCQPCGRGE